MSDLEHFIGWARRAREETAPTPDVSCAVMRRLREADSASLLDEPAMWVFSAASACAALVCGLLGYAAWVAMGDPLSMWLDEMGSWGSLL